jgi:hypothetical protein
MFYQFDSRKLKSFAWFISKSGEDPHTMIYSGQAVLVRGGAAQAQNDRSRSVASITTSRR